MTDKVLILSPHSDDAALSVPATIGLLVRAGCEVTVLTCFSRSNWAPARAELHETEPVTRVRIEEDEKFAAMMGGRVRTIPLGFDDYPLRHPASPSPILPGREPERQVVAELSSALLPSVQGAQALIVPLGLGDHIDHRTVNAAALLVCESTATAFYEDVPYRLSFGEEQIRSCVQRTADRWKVRLHPGRTDSDDWCDLWVRAVSCYPSQFSTEDVIRLQEILTSAPGERLWITSTRTVLHGLIGF